MSGTSWLLLVFVPLVWLVALAKAQHPHPPRLCLGRFRVLADAQHAAGGAAAGDRHILLARTCPSNSCGPVYHVEGANSGGSFGAPRPSAARWYTVSDHVPQALAMVQAARCSFGSGGEGEANHVRVYDVGKPSANARIATWFGVVPSGELR